MAFCCLPFSLLGQMRKGAVSVEAGLNLQINGTTGGNALDLSRNFSFQTADQFYLRLQTGYFASDRDEMGILGGYTWSNQGLVYNGQSGFGTANAFISNIKVRGWTGGVYYRRYVFVKGKFFGGIAGTLGGGKTKVWETSRTIFVLPPVNTERVYNEKNAQITANLFFGYSLNRHIGLRVSFGEMRYTVVKSTLSNVTETQFNADLRSTGFPGVSVFRVF